MTERTPFPEAKERGIKDTSVWLEPGVGLRNKGEAEGANVMTASVECGGVGGENIQNKCETG